VKCIMNVYLAVDELSTQREGIIIGRSAPFFIDRRCRWYSSGTDIYPLHGSGLSVEPRKFILVRLAMQHYRGNLVCRASCVVAKIDEKETTEEDGKGWKIDDDDEGASIASVRIQVDREIPP